MFRRVRREQRNARAFQHQHGPHDGMLVTTGHSQVLEISVFETGVPPRFRIHFFDSTLAPVGPPKHETVTLETVRPDGARQTFAFANTGDYLEATSELPEPHEFTAQINLAHGGHAHTYAIKFVEGHHHQQHAPANVMTAEYQDAHERGHAQELHARFTSQTVTTKQIILFGLTGGLLPCPAAFAVLLVCLQIKQFALGFAVVLAFSVGLAVTLVAIGSAAALSMRAASRRFAGVSRLARRLPYASAGLMSVIGLVVTAFGLRALLR
jgi:nickel/cobalt exporter